MQLSIVRAEWKRSEQTLHGSIRLRSADDAASAKHPRECADCALRQGAVTTALAGAEHDYDALDLAIETYEQLLTTAQNPAQVDAINSALSALRGWKL